MTAKSLIIPRNVRTHWKQLGLTVQGLINSKPCFLGCLIGDSWSLIKSLFRMPFAVSETVRVLGVTGQGRGAGVSDRPVEMQARCGRAGVPPSRV